MKRSMVDVLLRLFIDETTERRSLRHGATILVEAEGAQRACCVARLYVVDNASRTARWSSSDSRAGPGTFVLLCHVAPTAYSSSGRYISQPCRCLDLRCQLKVQTYPTSVCSSRPSLLYHYSPLSLSSDDPNTEHLTSIWLVARL